MSANPPDGNPFTPSLIITSFIPVFEKTLEPKKISWPIVIEVNDVQEWNAFETTNWTDFANVKFFKDEHSINAFWPIVINPCS